MRETRELVLGEAVALQTMHRGQVLNEAVVVESRLTEARTNATDVGTMDTGSEIASAATSSFCAASVRTRHTC